MTILDAIGHIAITAFYIALVPAVLVFVFLPTCRAAFTDRASDKTTIAAHFEGPVGLAGPNMKVLSINRAGTQFSSRSQPAARKYEVTLQRTDGSEVRKFVGVSVGYFDDGNLFVFDRNGLFAKRAAV